MYLAGGLLTLADLLGVLPAPIKSPATGCGAASYGSGLGGLLLPLRTSAPVEPLGRDPPELLGVGPPQWREFRFRCG